MAERRPALRVASAVALVLAAAAGVTVACDSSSDAPAAPLDPGPTFGVEVTVSVSGNGRVVSAPNGIDCPSTCFARITSADRDFDGADIGLSLAASPGLGSHFVGWKAQPLVSGTRARGPAECSPMTRNALGPPFGRFDGTLVLPYGETQGTPPKGLEAACADYTTVPVAYALVATFEEDPGQPFFGDDAAAPGEALFEPPALGVVVAREVGIVGDKIYFRYDQGSTSSVVVSGAKDGKSVLSAVIQTQTANTLYRAVAIGPNLVAQDLNGTLEMVDLTTQQRRSVAAGPCVGMTTDLSHGYCRQLSGSQSFLSTLALNGSTDGFSVLPFGSDLAVDDTNVYFTAVPFGSFQSATLETSRKADGGGIDAAPLVSGLNSPSRLLVTDSDLIWIDSDESNQPVVIGHAPKTGTSGARMDLLGAPASAIAVDPMNPKTIYVANALSERTAEILRLPPEGGSFEVALFGMESVNGLAVDETYIYWTQNDGRVYRAPK